MFAPPARARALTDGDAQSLAPVESAKSKPRQRPGVPPFIEWDIAAGRDAPGEVA